MKFLRYQHWILPFLFVLPSLGEAGGCVGRLTPEQYRACQAMKSQNAVEESKSRAAVREAALRLSEQERARLSQTQQVEAAVAREQARKQKEWLDRQANARAEALNRQRIKTLKEEAQAYKRMR